MKKIISILTFSLLLFSCSTENENSSQMELAFDLKKTVNEKYDGKIFKFNDTEDFLNFYNELSNLKANEFQDYLKIKGNNNSIFFRNLSKEEDVLEDVTQSKNSIDTKNDREIVVSEFLSTIFNFDNEIMIGNDIILLNNKGEIVSKTSENLIGYINNTKSANELSRHNVNYYKSWTVNRPGNKRATLTIFNETLYLNNNLSSSKLFYRVHQQYKSCSFWRCTWKDDNTGASYYPNLNFSACSWNNNYNINETVFTSLALYTKNISQYVFIGPCQPNVTLYLTGSFQMGNYPNIANISYDFNPW